MGTHKELLARPGEYTRLIAGQREGGAQSKNSVAFVVYTDDLG